MLKKMLNLKNSQHKTSRKFGTLKKLNVTIIGTEKREETHDLAQKIFSAKS